MVRISPAGFSSRDGQVESTAYIHSQLETQQRQLAERTAHAEQAMMQAAHNAQLQRDTQQRHETQQRETSRHAEQQREAQRCYDEQQTRDRYVQELFQMTAHAASQHASTAHPELSGATSGNVHSSAVLKGRGWGAEQNSTQPPSQIPTYHTDSPVVTYRTDTNTDMLRAHAEHNQVGGWSTNSRDLDHGDVSGVEARRRLSLPNIPSYVSDVDMPIGTFVTASRPISGEARQYGYAERIASWFSNRRTLD